jgi:hypothetical protein
MVKFKPVFERLYPRLETVIAVIALINLGLVFFDLAYLHLRPTYRRYLPIVTQVYDPVKTIKAHPQTEYYQTQVNRLKAQLANHDVQSPLVADSLAELQALSQQLTVNPTFVHPQGNNVLATVQTKIRSRASLPLAQNALAQFWSADYLAQQGWQPELEFWESQIQPLFQANYYRPVTPWGWPVDYFWLLDLPFMLVFAADILMRVLTMHRHRPDLTWVNVILRRWYDLFLLLPFWRWLRVIPVALRLYQVELLNLEPVRTEAQRDIIITVGADLAGIVGIEIIDQMKASISQGDLFDWLPAADPHSSAHNGKGMIAQRELVAIATHLYQVSADHVLPRLRPDLEALVQHSLSQTLKQVPGYSQVNHIPGLGQVSTQMVEQLSGSIIQSIYQGLTGAWIDANGKAISHRLQQTLRQAVAEEFRQHNTPEEVQTRLLTLLETFKVNYVKALTEAEGEKLADATERLRRQIQ